MRTLSLIIALFFTGCFVDSDEGEHAGIYESCSATECQDSLDCYTVAFEVGRTGSMCTDQCVDDRDCPFGGACFMLVGDPVDQNVCFERCDVDLDCPRGFLCANAERDGVVVDAICLPE